MARTLFSDADRQKMLPVSHEPSPRHAAARTPQAAGITGATGLGTQPVHVVYGGADRYGPGTAEKLGGLAKSLLDRYAPEHASPGRRTFAEVFGTALGIDSAGAARVRARVVAKLEREPVEDFRADFEDGFGYRSDAEEDDAAEHYAQRFADAIDAGAITRWSGFRVKSMGAQTAQRAARTLDIVLTALAARTGGSVPQRFVVTLPKVEHAQQAESFGALLGAIEARAGIDAGAVGVELMIETPGALFDRHGALAMPALIDGCGGRCRSLHFGAYDFLSSLGIASADQRLSHAACDHARSVMQLGAAHAGVALCDGATATLPIERHRAKGRGGDPIELTSAQHDENRAAVIGAWRMHAEDVRRSLAHGYWQGWDLHPGQLVSRYAAVYAYFDQHAASAGARLTRFLNASTRATSAGDVFDDAATAQGLMNFFLRGLGCGAFDAGELFDGPLAGSGLDAGLLATRSFARIAQALRER